MFIFLIFPFRALALETDNYFVWKTELKDSSHKINEYLNREIIEVLSTSTGDSCEELTNSISKSFASYFVHDDPIANWLMQNLDQHEMHPDRTDYVEESIYRDPYLFYIPKFGLAPNIQVSRRYFGMDKLSHFGATGKHYYDRYRKALKRGKSDTVAMREAISYGIREENTLYGYWASGVFSFADLEADYQGMLFYKNLCASTVNPYLEKRESGQWAMRRSVDIKDYVNAYWDESYNLSYRLPKNWKKVSRIIKADYCSLLHTKRVKDRFDLYSEDQPSFSVQHLRTLQDENSPKVPNPLLAQSLETLCH